MRESEVKKYIGENNWKLFNKFMNGKTVGINKDGTFDYYEYDVKRFKLLSDLLC